MQNQQNEGQEVEFGDNGNSIVSARLSVDTKGILEYIQSLGYQLPAMLAQQQITHNAEEPYLRALQVQDIVTGTKLFNDKVFGTLVTVTPLALKTLDFDSKAIVSHKVKHLVEMTGFCLCVVVWPIEDYQVFQEEEIYQKNPPYQGVMEFVSFNELLW